MMELATVQKSFLRSLRLSLIFGIYIRSKIVIPHLHGNEQAISLLYLRKSIAVLMQKYCRTYAKVFQYFSNSIAVLAQKCCNTFVIVLPSFLEPSQSADADEVEGRGVQGTSYDIDEQGLANIERVA